MGTTPCPRGVLIVPDADHKKSIPFLITVREEDVLWNKKDIEAIKTKIKNKLSENDEANIEVLNPKPSYRFNYNDWVCCIESDCYCTLTKKINIDDSFVRDELIDIRIKRPNIELPFLMEDSINIQLTKNMTPSTLYSVNDVSVFGVNKNENNLIESFNVALQSSSRISDTYVDDFNGCFIYISISGYVATLPEE
jgi:hypothetical protein